MTAESRRGRGAEVIGRLLLVFSVQIPCPQLVCMAGNLDHIQMVQSTLELTPLKVLT